MDLSRISFIIQVLIAAFVFAILFDMLSNPAVIEWINKTIHLYGIAKEVIFMNFLF